MAVEHRLAGDLQRVTRDVEAFRRAHPRTRTPSLAASVSDAARHITILAAPFGGSPSRATGGPVLCLIACPDPDCNGPAEIVDRFAVPSTHGPVEHVKTYCLHRHSFLLPAERVVTPAMAATRSRTRHAPQDRSG